MKADPNLAESKLPADMLHIKKIRNEVPMIKLTIMEHFESN